MVVGFVGLFGFFSPQLFSNKKRNNSKDDPGSSPQSDSQPKFSSHTFIQGLSQYGFFTYS